MAETLSFEATQSPSPTNIGHAGQFLHRARATPPRADVIGTPAPAAPARAGATRIRAAAAPARFPAPPARARLTAAWPIQGEDVRCAADG